MKKITKVMALILTLALVFSGCAVTQDVYKINANNNTVTVSSRTELDKAKTLTVMKKTDETLKNDTEADQAFRTFVKEVYGDMGYAHSVSTTKRDNKDYYVLSLKRTQKIEEFNQENASSGMKYISKEAFYCVVTSDLLDEEAISEYKQYGITEEDLKAIQSTITVTFPNKIVSSQKGTISDTNPNEITFRFGVETEGILFATTNSKITISSIKKEIKDKYEIQVIKGVKKPSIKSVKVTSVKKKKGTVKVTIKKVKNATYEVQYSTDKKFRKAKTKTKKTKKTAVIIKNLKAGKKYYFRVRAVAIPRDNYIYENEISKYSKKKSVVVKKSKKK